MEAFTVADPNVDLIDMLIKRCCLKRIAITQAVGILQAETHESSNTDASE